MVKIKTSKPEVLWNAKCILGEGTLWVREHKSIYFTDIKKIGIFRFRGKSGMVTASSNFSITSCCFFFRYLCA